MAISAEQIKDLRERTGAGITAVKTALEETGGDMEKAAKILERKLGAIAGKKVNRETRTGIIEAYIHSNARVGAMVELYCETDFVARNHSFKELAHDIAMHVAAMRPQFLSLDSIPADVWQAEKSRFEEEAKALGKPDAITNAIVEGKLKSYFGVSSLLEQPFVKVQEKTVGQYINEAVGRFGENIRIGHFVVLEL